MGGQVAEVVMFGIVRYGLVWYGMDLSLTGRETGRWCDPRPHRPLQPPS